MRQVNDKELRRVVSAIKQARNICFHSVGSASGVVRPTANQFTVPGIRANAQSDILLNLRSVSYLKPDEFMVVINYDGYSKNLYSQAKVQDGRGIFSPDEGNSTQAY